ncbi:hypothetical protein [Daejeonella sp.]|uniref:hypothetical protein n=1 Tax=Daejeonella sp. TaxID=2805397 RepID=UPI0025C05D34|nr:hypothetical protein [Daejeonella sp.]
MEGIEQNNLLLHLNDIWKEKEKCRLLKESKRFSPNDVRNTYFSLIMQIINDYYTGMIEPYFMKRLSIPFQNGVLSPYFPSSLENKLYSNLGFLCEDQYIKTWHDLKKVGIVSNLWIVFEDSIDIIYSKIATEDDVNNYKYAHFNRIRGLIEGKISEEDLKHIKAKLQSDYIGINNKYNYVLNSLEIEKSEAKGLKKYREFLQFFNVLRNTLHTNSRPIKDFNFNTSIGKFKFEKNKHIDFFTTDILYASVVMFIEIFDFIRTKLKYDGEIFNSATLVSSAY